MSTEHIQEKDIKEDTLQEPKKNTAKTVRLGILFAIVLVFGFAGGLSVGAKSRPLNVSNIPLLGDGLNPTIDQNLDFTDFWKVYNVLNTRFVQTHASSTPSDAKKNIYGAIQGMTASFGDPYTVFFPPEEAKAFQEGIAGNFSGVGMEVGMNKDKIITVIAPLKGTPADKAGMLPGDLILSINGKSTDSLSTEAAIKMIRGPKGTKVVFTIFRDGKTKEISVIRDTIQVPNIEESFDEKNQIYTIALYEFTENSASLFDSAIRNFRSSGTRKLIIDLRGNPGGYLDQAVSIASHFLPKGAEVVTEDYVGKEKNNTHRSLGFADIPTDAKIVILMNQGSASASEILAGALQDARVATLIGTRSFGKGSVQQLIDVNGAALKVTVARWLTPSGRSISDGGLTPDIKVERDNEDITAKKDPQKDRAIEFLTTGR
jgi:carboxyl-terminal processing protease